MANPRTSVMCTLKGFIMFKKIAILATLSPLSAFAALPAGVSTAVSTAQADGIELGGLMLGLAVAVGVIFWLKRKV